MVSPLSCLIWVTLYTQSKINERDFTTNSIFGHDYGPIALPMMIMMPGYGY